MKLKCLNLTVVYSILQQQIQIVLHRFVCDLCRWHNHHLRMSRKEILAVSLCLEQERKSHCWKQRKSPLFSHLTQALSTPKASIRWILSKRKGQFHSWYQHKHYLPRWLISPLKGNWHRSLQLEPFLSPWGDGRHWQTQDPLLWKKSPFLHKSAFKGSELVQN